MMLEMDYMDIAGDCLSEMRLLVEGAVTLFEDEANILCRLAKDAGNEDARCAFNDIGSALYCLRRHITHLQAAHYLEATRDRKTDA